MTLEEAATILGLDPGGPFEPAAVRAAYLRAVKRHKPESDPEGFKRVRQAYEMLQQHQELLSRFSAPPPEPRPPPAASPAPSAPSAPSAPPDSVVPSEAPDLEGLRRRLRELPAHPWQARVALLREAQERFPGHPDLRELLVHELAQAGQWPALVEVLRAAARAGDRWSLLRLVGSFPNEAKEAELESLRREGTTGSLLAVVAALVKRAQSEPALEALEQALAPVPVEGLEPPVTHQILRIVLDLHQCGDATGASRAFALLSRKLGPLGLTARDGATDTTIAFLISSELEQLPDLPAEVRQGVARAALSGHATWAWDALDVLLRYDGERRTRQLLAHIEEKAPNIRRLLGPLPLGRSPSAVAPALGLVALLAFVFAKFAPDVRARDPALPPGHHWAVDQWESGYFRVCRADFESPPCRTLHDLFATVRARGGCQDLPRRRQELAGATAAATGDMKEYLVDLSRSVSTLCQEDP